MLPSIKKNISSVAIPDHFRRSAIEMNQRAVNSYALAISGKLCNIDGEINLTEKRAFLALFPFFEQQHLSLLKETGENDDSVYLHCKRFCKFTNGDRKTSARLFARLFKLAIIDDAINIPEMSFLEKISPMIGLTPDIFEKALEIYFLEDIKMPKAIFHSEEKVKSFYKNQIRKLHPDIFQETSFLSKRIKKKINYLANERVKLLNENYRKHIS
jgi:hypothetical protein